MTFTDEEHAYLTAHRLGRLATIGPASPRRPPHLQGYNSRDVPA
jgi:hypothetical protein